MNPGLTPSQTVGPFFAIGLTWPDEAHVVPEGTPGAIWLRGRVIDGAGLAVPDALVETWQADPGGHFNHPDDPSAASAAGFRGFGRCGTDAAGNYAIRTVKPGPVPGPGGVSQAPHVDISVLGRGLLDRLVTRLYFGDEHEANSTDPVLCTIGDMDARATLIALPEADGYDFDIRLQGDNETVFFSV